MTTLATMKSRIAAELRRTNIEPQIAHAIETAIEAYQHERFAFNESREIDFSTIAGQEFYDAADDEALGRLARIDYVVAEIGSSYYTLTAMKPEDIEKLNATGDFTGQPLSYCYYQDQLRIYPVPAEAYNVRMGAQITITAPATDDEADNPWMTTAERLIRCRAKYELYEHVLNDDRMADRFNPDNTIGPTYRALSEMRSRTQALTNMGGWVIEPTSF